MLDNAIDIFAHGTAVTFMTGLGATGLCLVPPLFAVARRRLRRGTRRLLRPLHPQHKIDQFFLRQTLQITTIHSLMDSGFRAHGKALGNYRDRIIELLRCAEIVNWIVRDKRGINTYYSARTGKDAMSYRFRPGVEVINKERWRALIIEYWKATDPDRFSSIKSAVSK